MGTWLKKRKKSKQKGKLQRVVSKRLRSRPTCPPLAPLLWLFTETRRSHRPACAPCLLPQWKRHSCTCPACHSTPGARACAPPVPSFPSSLISPKLSPSPLLKTTKNYNQPTNQPASQLFCLNISLQPHVSCPLYGGTSQESNPNLLSSETGFINQHNYFLPPTAQQHLLSFRNSAFSGGSDQRPLVCSHLISCSFGSGWLISTPFLDLCSWLIRGSFPLLFPRSLSSLGGLLQSSDFKYHPPSDDSKFRCLLPQTCFHTLDTYS